MKKTKRIISLFLSVFMLISITAGIDFSAYAETTGSQIVEYAKTLKGCSYKYAARGPKCFDCSGFVYYVYKHFGFTVPTSSSSYTNLSKYGKKVTGDSNAKLGDIVVWSDHVGIYTGNGKVIHSLNSKKGVCETVVKDFVNTKGVKNPSHYYLRVNGVYEAVTNPSLTVKSVSNLKADSVTLAFNVKNPSKLTLSNVGVQIRKKGTSEWKTKKMAVSKGNTNATAFSFSCNVGSGKEWNMALSSGTTYEYRAYVVYKNKYFYTSTNTFKTAVISPSVSVKPIADLTEKSVVFNFTVNNPSKLTIKTTGVQIREKGSTEWRTQQEAVNTKSANASSISISRTVGSDKALNIPLEAGKTYEYRAYAIYNNCYYYSSVSTFATKPAEENIQASPMMFKNEPSAQEVADEQQKLTASVLKTTVYSNGSFKLSWKAIAGADKYEVYHKQADDSYKLVKTTAETSFSTACAEYGKTYTYKIRAVRTIDSQNFFSSDDSAAVNAVNNKKLQAPTLKGTVNSNGSFKLSWNVVSGAVKYGIYYKNANGKYTWVTTVTGTSWTTGTAQYGRTYNYKVLAVGSTGSITSEYSNAVNVTNKKKLQTPSNIKIKTNKNGKFTISWNKVIGADKYEVYVLDSKTNKYKLVKTTTSNTITTGVAAKGKTYKYKVRAVKNKNSSATSAYSSVVSKKR